MSETLIQMVEREIVETMAKAKSCQTLQEAKPQFDELKKHFDRLKYLTLEQLAYDIRQAKFNRTK